MAVGESPEAASLPRATTLEEVAARALERPAGEPRPKKRAPAKKLKTPPPPPKAPDWVSIKVTGRAHRWLKDEAESRKICVWQLVEELLEDAAAVSATPWEGPPAVEIEAPAMTEELEVGV